MILIVASLILFLRRAEQLFTVFSVKNMTSVLVSSVVFIKSDAGVVIKTKKTVFLKGHSCKFFTVCFPEKTLGQFMLLASNMKENNKPL